MKNLPYEDFEKANEARKKAKLAKNCSTGKAGEQKSIIGQLADKGFKAARDKESRRIKNQKEAVLGQLLNSAQGTKPGSKEWIAYAKHYAA